VIQFRVEKNQITNASLNYSVLNSAGERPADCPLGDGGAHAGTVDPTPINGSTFTLKTQGGGQTQLTFSGTFKSPSTAEGTMHLKGVLAFCDKPYETDVTWMATKQVSASATPVATAKPAVTLPTMTPAVSYQSVVEAFFQAVNTKNVDAALAMAEDQVFFQIGSTNGIGKEKLKTYLTTLTASGATFTTSNYKPLGSTNVDFAAQVSDGTVYKRCDASISARGKLQTLTCFVQ
jgi:hypothetical protein